jgi:hypothetical protein
MQIALPHGATKRVAVALGVTALLLGGCAASCPQRDDAYLRRVELLALLQTLNADLLSHDSATLTLERWCAVHHLAGDVPPEQVRIVARRIHEADKPIPDELRTRLAISSNEPLRYRHVQLVCGERVLSEADNWYVPGRLTPEMNHLLDTTDEPFGKVVKSLGFKRRTISADLLWSPLPPGWEMAATPSTAHDPLQISPSVLRHVAVLFAADQTPFSVVNETYTDQLLAFRK